MEPLSPAAQAETEKLQQYRTGRGETTALTMPYHHRMTAPEESTASVIFLHGLTESCSQCDFIVHELQLRPSLRHIDFILPNAPMRPHKVFDGRETSGWFSVNGIGVKTLEEFTDDGPGISSTLEVIERYIKEEEGRGIPRKRIAVGGFSSGAAITLALAIASKYELAGFVSLSGFIPAPNYYESITEPVNRNTPLLLVNGTADAEVPFVTAQQGNNLLRERFGFTNVEFRAVDGMRHSVSPTSLEETANFLERVLP